jgi:hypothetical protein
LIVVRYLSKRAQLLSLLKSATVEPEKGDFETLKITND